MEEPLLHDDGNHHILKGGVIDHKPNGNSCIEKESLISDDVNGDCYKYSKTKTQPHPRLRGGQAPLPHTFSRAQMEVFTAIAEALFPSIPPSDDHHEHTSPHMESFYKLSSLDMEVPIYTLGFLMQVLNRIHLILFKVMLLILSTRLGTFIMCGSNCFVKDFPFIQPFPKLSIKARENSLKKWATSRIKRFQAFFKVAKCAVVWNCFARADEKGHNPTWEAIGYYLPPTSTIVEKMNVQRKPLEGKVIDVKTESYLCERLKESGFWVHEGKKSYLQAMERNKKVALSKKTINISTTNQKCVTIKCDVVVIGSGSGGGVVAGALAKAGMKVLVIEKGDYFARGDYSQYEYPSALAMLEGPNNLATNDGSMLIKAGTTVGGGSAINWSASLRTPDHVLSEWADIHGLKLFKDPKYKEAMDAICTRMNAKVGFKKESLQNSVLRQGCSNLGYRTDDVACNAIGEHYCGRCEQGCPTGAKQSTAETWLVDATANGAVILAGCKAIEVLHVEGGTRKKRRAVGVVAAPVEMTAGFCGANRIYVHARAVVAAGGALHTPLLLRRSGLCNGAIGKNLHLHPTLMAWGYLPKDDKKPNGDCNGHSKLDEDNVSDSVLKDGKSFEGSIITLSCTELSGEKCGDGYGALLQCPALLPGSYAVVAPWLSGARFKKFMSRYSRTCLVFTLPRDRTCGSITEDSHDGSICIDYNMCVKDKTVSIQALTMALRVLASIPGMEEVGTLSVHDDYCHPRDVEDLIARIKARGIHGLDYSINSAHQMGSCRMGSDPSRSAVDPQCETWEVEGLFIGDTSVFPTALGVNPMVTAQAIAFCTAQNILSFLDTN